MLRGFESVLLIAIIAVSGLSTARAFKYVYIPCDASMPMQEWELKPQNPEDHIGCLTTHLQKWFRKAGKLSTTQKSELAELVKLQTRQKYNEEDAKRFDNFENLEIGQSLLDGETVEIVTLLPPIEQYGYISVSLYIDDRGYVRQLPHNARATNLMHSVSTRDGPILGDAFIGRSYDNEMDEFARLDMCVSDLSSDAGWVKLCQEYVRESTKNADRTKIAMDAIQNKQVLPEDKERQSLVEEAQTMLQDSLQDEENPITRDGYEVFPGKHKPQPQTEKECVDIGNEIRDMAKDAFNAGNMELALRKYSKAKRYLVFMHHISKSAPHKVPEDDKGKLLTSCDLNMALTYLKMSKWKHCQRICSEVLEREPGNIKALYRLGCAERDQGEIDLARQTFKKAISLAPGDKSLRKGLVLCDQKQKIESRQGSKLARKMFGAGFGNIYPTAQIGTDKDKDHAGETPTELTHTLSPSQKDGMEQEDVVPKENSDSQLTGQDEEEQLEQAVQAVKTAAKKMARKKDGTAKVEEAIEALRNLREGDSQKDAQSDQAPAV